MELNASYWQERWLNQKTGWDIGHANHGLVNEVKKRFPTSTKILIPGAGRGHEAEALWSAGYLNTYVCDWAPEAFDYLRASEVLAKVIPDIEEAKSRLIVSDFFELTDSYDLILEQTFFCAIDPSMREKYVQQAAYLLKPVGKWMGILFDCHFPTEGPPFGGDKQDYISLFSESFEIEHLDRFKDSITPRQNKELLGLMYCKSM
ncbi:MAG: SAM-dependent methyltransferase [Saprospiraceae bacterium]